MANVTITSASVVPSSDAVYGTGTAGESIAVGDMVYLDSGTTKLKLAASDDDIVTDATMVAVGMSMNDASLDQPVNYLIEDPALAMGSALTSGTVYMVSFTGGKVAPVADLGVAEYLTVVGVSNSATELNLKIVPGGVL